VVTGFEAAGGRVPRVRQDARWPAPPGAGVGAGAGVGVGAGEGPAPGEGIAPAPLPGFIVSTFSPLVAHVAEQVLRREYGAPPADAARAGRTATVLVSRYGDVTSAVHVAGRVDAGERVAPLMFYQAVPNAVAGYLAARWGLRGPVVCLSPLGDPMAEGLAVAAELLDDGDADEALIVAAEQDIIHNGQDASGAAHALLVDGRMADGRMVAP
jgi:3-oxoacyl-(acyl-carrier-protein) synthase